MDRLRKAYGGTVAVDDVSLVVGSGEFVTLLGPSGSGKTTTLMMVAGFEHPDAGEILLDDRPIGRLAPYARGIGMVFQSYALFPHMTVFDNIAFPLRMRRWDSERIRAGVGRVLDVVNLGGYGSRFPRQLSGGQQQRVALARALVFDPPVLLMDEPLGALDKQLRTHLQVEIKRIQREVGVTVIYVTHDQEEALTMSDRIAVMNHGRILQLDSPPDIYERPLTRFVASFVGETNFLPARMESVPGRAKLIDTGRVIQVAGGDKASPEADVVLAVRPEKIWLLPGASPVEAGNNAMAARVESRVFVGDSHRYEIVCEGGTRLAVKQQNGAHIEAFDAGAEVLACWPTEAARVLPAEEPHP